MYEISFLVFPKILRVKDALGLKVNGQVILSIYQKLNFPGKKFSVFFFKIWKQLIINIRRDFSVLGDSQKVTLIALLNIT